MTTAIESPARVEIDEQAVWSALENFFTGSASEARQMRTRDFGIFDAFISSSIPLLDVTIDDVRYGAWIQEVNKAGQYLAGAVITVAYSTGDESSYTYVLVDLMETGSPRMPQALPTARQSRWEQVQVSDS